MKHGIDFKWSQQLDSYHPDFSITATFDGWAEIKDVNANEIEIKTCSVRWDGMLGTESVSVVRGCVGSAQNFFLGKCREAARAAYNKQQMAQYESEPANAGFIPSPEDTKYNDNAGDISFPETPERQQ